MDRRLRAIGAGLLLIGTALHGGCGSGAGGLAVGAAANDAPVVNAQDPMARPVQVAWTSARAQRCAFYFDPAKLKATYISYEARQGAAGDQLAKIQSTYDSTFKTVSANVSNDADYCSDKKGAEIKADLQRHLAGDYTPNLPKAKVANPCGVFGCGPQSDEKVDAKKMFEDMEKRSVNK